jgi:hypothetical protein
VADWEVDSPRLRNNLLEVLRDARDRAVRRDVPTVEDARRWQRDTMAGLDVPDTEYVGRFRGEPGLETTRVWIGSHEGVRPGEVARELAAFQHTLQLAVGALDARYPAARNSMETVSPPSSICVRGRMQSGFASQPGRRLGGSDTFICQTWATRTRAQRP